MPCTKTTDINIHYQLSGNQLHFTGRHKPCVVLLYTGDGAEDWHAEVQRSLSRSEGYQEKLRTGWRAWSSLKWSRNLTTIAYWKHSGVVCRVWPRRTFRQAANKLSAGKTPLKSPALTIFNMKSS